MEQKTERLSDLHKDLVSAQDDRSKFDALNALFTEYHSFNADSAYSTAQRQLLLAQKMGERNLVINALLNKINILNLAGMYLESMTLVDSIHYDELPEYLRAYYFHTKRSLYGKLADFSSFGHEREYYEKLTDQYRDSLLSVNDPNSVFYALIKADQLNVHNRSKEAIALLEGYINNNKLDEHELAICAFTLSDSYDYVHDTENQKKQLLISSIADMKSAVREYVSLRKLALLLYKEGDLERAYKLLTIAVEDATKSNARQRIVELNDSYPMINGIYVETVRRQKRSLEKAIIVITAMAIVLIILIIYLRKQMKRLSESRRKIEEANIKLTDLNEQLIESNCKLNELNTQLTDTNERLNILNSQLVKSNTKLQEAYSEIAEISELKEVYICQYMDQSLEHIEMLDTYRKSIGKLISNGKVEDLKKLVKSTKIIDDKLKLFYEQFDKTFLNLFPTFVEDFNSLLLPEEVITPKKAGTLNTELRIFALIRLGINDSVKIAKFLRYSLTTIYNYRTKVRNKARGDRNQRQMDSTRRLLFDRQHFLCCKSCFGCTWNHEPYQFFCESLICSFIFLKYLKKDWSNEGVPMIANSFFHNNILNFYITMNKVLIVEASDSDRRLMSGLLTRSGYEPIVAEDMEARHISENMTQKNHFL